MAAFQPIHLLLVMTGGGIGAGLRYLCGRWALALSGPGYPWVTLSVNIAGRLAKGLQAGVLPRTGGSEQLRLSTSAGRLGSYTHSSDLSLALYTMFKPSPRPTATASSRIPHSR